MDDDAYGRVTEPERYRPLHEAAAALVDRLATTHRCDVQEGTAVDPELVDRVTAARVVRLVPAGGGAPVTVAFTDFPGVLVRWGRWCTEAFPACGCDACDEQVENLVDDLEARAEAVVSGRFEESRTTGPPTVGHVFTLADGSTSSSVETLDPARELALGTAEAPAWAAWEAVSR